MNASDLIKKPGTITNSLLENNVETRAPKQSIAKANLDNGLALVDRSVHSTKTDRLTRRRRYWENMHVAIEVNGSNKKTLSEREVSSSFTYYSKDQLPWPDEHHTYFKDNEGSLILKKSEHCVSSVGMTLYGVNTNQIPQYVTEQLPSPDKKALHHKEAFATAKKKGIEQKLRDVYPIETYSSCQNFAQDRGHGIDFILTIPEDKHSSIDASNFTPQNSVYNRQVRKSLVGQLIKEDGISVKEINIYGTNPKQVAQAIGAKYTISKNKEKHLIDVPEGFLFLVYDSLKQIRNIYYFPNFIDYQALKQSEKIKYTEVPKIFEIAVPTEKLFGKEINLYGVNIYEENKTNEEIEIEICMKVQVGLRMLFGRYGVIFTQKDKADTWIPLEARKALERTLAFKQLHEMAENEFRSIDQKITFFELLVDEKRELGQVLNTVDPAFLWLKRIEEQVAIESTLEEKLKLHDTYLLIKSSFPKIYDDLIKAKDTELLITILNQFNKEDSDMEEKLQIADESDDPIQKAICEDFLEKVEKKIISELTQINTLEGMVALDALHGLADYYGGIYKEERSRITDHERKKAHDLYQILFTEFLKEVDWDGVLDANLLKQLFMESPELVSYQHRLTYANFFKKVGLKESADFWDQKAAECKTRETSPVYEKVELVSGV